MNHFRPSVAGTASTYRSATRQGASIVLALTVVALIGMILLGDSIGLGRRLHQAGARQSRVQGREYALGAAALPDGTAITVGTWTITHRHDAAGDHRSASGPAGCYRIDLGVPGDHAADAGRGVESWTPVPTSAVKAAP